MIKCSILTHTHAQFHQLSRLSSLSLEDEVHAEIGRSNVIFMVACTIPKDPRDMRDRSSSTKSRRINDKTTKTRAGRSFGEIGPAPRQAQMAWSPFGCNLKKSVFGSKPVLDKQAAPEPVLLLVDKMQIVTAVIPFNSKNAPLTIPIAMQPTHTIPLPSHAMSSCQDPWAPQRIKCGCHRV